MRGGRALGARPSVPGFEALYQTYSASNPVRSGVMTSVWTRHIYFSAGPYPQ
jgi:hypothetical protein